MRNFFVFCLLATWTRIWIANLFPRSRVGRIPVIKRLCNVAPVYRRRLFDSVFARVSDYRREKTVDVAAEKESIVLLAKSRGDRDTFRADLQK